MMEDCATSMSAPHGCTDDKAVIESFKDALKGRIGAERFRMWFANGVTITVSNQASGNGAGNTTHAASTENASNDSPTEPIQGEYQVTLAIRGQFALDRLRQNFIRELRGAAMQAFGGRTDIILRLDEPAATQAELPLSDGDNNNELDGKPTGTLQQGTLQQGTVQKGTVQKVTAAGRSRVTPGQASRVKSRRSRPQSITSYLSDATVAKRDSRAVGKQHERLGDKSNGGVQQLEFPELEGGKDRVSRSGVRPALEVGSDNGDRSASPARSSKQKSPATAAATPEDTNQRPTVSNFIAGTSNQLAYTALSMVCQAPQTASPVFFCGPTGSGKTHLMSAIADQLRRRHRMRRVMHLSAEQFTNDFISSVGNSGITAFRRRYREVDALLIDDVQFMGAKKATLREMLYTVETLASEGRPLIFSGLQAPSEIAGLSHELVGRMASGLVCPIQPLDIDIRRKILERWITERCPLEVPSALLDQINPMLAGDGRVVSGVVNMINTLQRMLGRVPTLDEIRQFGGNLLRGSTPIATLSVIETAVCDAFHLPHNTLRGRSQTRAVTGPRMLAMYLARQLTSSAYAEIADHFGGKSHSTAISAENNIKKWLESGKSIGRGQLAMSTREAIARVENLLRCG